MKSVLKLLVFLTVLVATVLAVLYLRSDVEPRSWQPSPLPSLSGKFASNTHFEGLKEITLSASYGPEDVAFDSDGNYYTGLHDGSIVRFDALTHNQQTIGNTGGRPLGMQFDHFGNLIIADANRGLLRMDLNHKIAVLTDRVNDIKMLFVDDLDIDDQGVIWFSDASTRFGYESFMKDFLEASFTGRLLSYDPQTEQTKVHLDGLFFANGVALGPDDRFVLVNETGTGRIHRLWLKGDKKGHRDVFYDGLPGNPDNLSFNQLDTFWVALPNVRVAAIERTSDQLLLRKLLGGLPIRTLTQEQTTAFVIGLDLNGKVSNVAFDEHSSYHSITSVNQVGDQLVLGSLLMNSVGVLSIPPTHKLKK